LAWTIEYADTAKGQLRKLDKQTARRIVDFMDERIAGLENPRNSGKALAGPHGGFWRYRVGDCQLI
jgi:mRNA interferase RelE/StbE